MRVRLIGFWGYGWFEFLDRCCNVEHMAPALQRGGAERHAAAQQIVHRLTERSVAQQSISIQPAICSPDSLLVWPAETNVFACRISKMYWYSSDAPDDLLRWDSDAVVVPNSPWNGKLYISLEFSQLFVASFNLVQDFYDNVWGLVMTCLGRFKSVLWSKYPKAGQHDDVWTFWDPNSYVATVLCKTYFLEMTFKSALTTLC